MENFDSLMNIFNVLKSSIQSKQNPAFSLVYLHFRYVCILILYTTLNVKAGKINYRKKSMTFLRGGGSPKERRYDVSRGQNRYVTLPLVPMSLLKYYIFTKFWSKRAQNKKVRRSDADKARVDDSW